MRWAQRCPPVALGTRVMAELGGEHRGETGLEGTALFPGAFAGYSQHGPPAARAQRVHPSH